MKLIITGASRGIGRFLFQRFREAGINVVGTYNKTIPDGSLNHYERIDLCKETEVEAFVKRAATDPALCLIHCAGVNINGMISKLHTEDWRWVIDGNLTSAFLLAKHCMPIMRNNGFGRIVFFSSIVPQIGIHGTAAYAASKAGLWGLMKVLAKEGSTKDITCNTLNLGYFDIGMINEVPKDLLTKTIQSIPMQKLGDPLNIFHAVDFILKADYLTGTQIEINGGLY